MILKLTLNIISKFELKLAENENTVLIPFLTKIFVKKKLLKLPG